MDVSHTSHGPQYGHILGRKLVGFHDFGGKLDVVEISYSTSFILIFCIQFSSRINILEKLDFEMGNPVELEIGTFILYKKWFFRRTSLSNDEN